VLRPADAMETAECWELAIRRADGPSLLVLTARHSPHCARMWARIDARVAVTFWRKPRDHDRQH